MSIDKTLEERKSKYGTFDDNAFTTQGFMHILSKGKNFDKLSYTHREAFHMIFHKISRCVSGDVMYEDNIHDIVGYAKLLEAWIKKTNKEKQNEKAKS